MKLQLAVCLTALFVAGTIANPVTQRPENQCATQCSDESKFDYAEGSKYVYAYSAETEIGVSGAQGNSSRLVIRANAEINVISKCEFVLQLRNVRLTGDDNAEQDTQLQRELEANPLRFAFQDGKIDNVCPSAREPSWVLNFKRGVLSTFQNSMDTLDRDHTVTEVDVAGHCSATYRVSNRGWVTNTITKTKDLRNCRERGSQLLSLQTTSYALNTGIQNSPLMNSTHECTQQIKNGRVVKAVCQENQILLPIGSNIDSGARAKTVQTLELIDTKTSTISGLDYIPTRTTLLYDTRDSDEGTGDSDRQSAAEKALRNLCRNAADDIRPETPQLFSTLVWKMQRLNENQLKSVFNGINRICAGNTKAKKFFYDALPLMSSGAGMRLMVQLIEKREVTDLVADIWFTSLAFQTQPDKEMIEALLPLLESDAPNPRAVLGITALAHSYCTQTNLECDEEPAINQLTRKLVKSLGASCQAKTDKEIAKMLVMLKGIGNVGQAVSASATLKKCYQNAENPMEIRLAAVRAFRRFSCSIERNDMMEAFLDQSMDTEVRIAAYKSVMGCPTPAVIEKIRATLEKEETNQVGSYVWTHLTNIQESDDPCKDDIKRLLTDHQLANKFAADARRFSRNFEGSAHSESFDMGAHAEADIIFSPKSYVPRSGMLNLTVDVFGNAVNMFEIGGRVEGLEPFVESFFGPNGYFPEKTVRKFLEQARNQDTEENMNTIDAAHEETKRQPEAKGSMYVKVLGNELHFSRFGEGADGYNGRQTLMEMIKRLAHESDEFEITKSVQFIDGNFVLPTATGLPLSISVNGSATVNVKMGGKLDIQDIRNMNCELQGKIKPSAAVEVAATMSVQAGANPQNRAGIRLKARLHSSTLLDGKLEMRRGELIHTQINVPNQKIEILNVQSEVLFIDGKRERPVSGDGRVRAESACTGRALDNIVGVQVCAEAANPESLLAGPYSLQLYAQKTDQSLSNYVAEYRWQKEMNRQGEIRTGRVSFNTPGSSIDRELTAELILNQPAKSFSARIVTPFKKISVNGKMNNDADSKKLEAKVQVDGREEAMMSAELRTERGERGAMVKYIPNVHVEYRGKEVAHGQGYAMYNSGKKFGLNMNMRLFSNQFAMTADVSKNAKIPGRFDFTFATPSRALNSKLSGFVTKGDAYLTSKLNLEYSINGNSKQEFDLSSKYKINRETSGNMKASASAELQTNLCPKCNAALALEHARSPTGSIDNLVTVSYGQNMEKKILIKQQHQQQGQWPNASIKSLFSVQNTATGAQYGFSVDHKLSENHLENQLTLNHGANNKRMMSSIKLGRNMDGARFMGKMMMSPSPDTKYELNGDLSDVDSSESKLSLAAKVNNNPWASSWVSYKNARESQEEMEKSIKLDMNLPNGDNWRVHANAKVKSNEAGVNGDVFYNGRKYSINAELVDEKGTKKIALGVSSPKFVYTGNAQVKIANGDVLVKAEANLNRQRRVTGTLQMETSQNKKSGLIRVDLDADDQRNKLSKADIQFQYEPTATGATGFATVKYQGKEYNAKFGCENNGSQRNFRHKSFARVQYSQGKQIKFNNELNFVNSNLDLNAELTTPFNGYEKYQVQIQHKATGPTQWQNEASLTLPKNKIYRVETNGNIESAGVPMVIEGSMKAQSPSGETYEGSFSTFNRHGIFRSSLSLKSPDNFLDISANRNSSGISTELKSSQRFMRSVSAYAGKSNGKMQLFGLWNNVEAGISGNMRRGQNSLEAQFELTTPFNLVKTLNYEIIASKSGSEAKLTTNWSVRNAQDQLLTEFDIDGSLSPNMVNVNAGYNLMDQYTNTLNVSYSRSNDNMRARLLFGYLDQNRQFTSIPILTVAANLRDGKYEATTQWAHDKSISVRVESMATDIASERKITVETPFYGLEEFGAHIQLLNANKEQLAKFIAFKNELKLQAYVSSLATVNRNGGDVKYDSQVKLSYNSDLIFNVQLVGGREFTETGGKECKLELVLNDKPYLIKYTVRKPNAKFSDYDIELSLSFPHDRFNGNFRSRHGPNGQGGHDHSTVLDFFNQKIELSGNSKARNGHQFEYELNTPFAGYKTFKTSGSYAKENRLQRGLFSLETPFNLAKVVKLEGKINTQGGITGDLVAEIGSLKYEVDLTGRGDDKKGVVNLNIRTPHFGYEEMTGKLVFDLSGEEKTFSFSIGSVIAVNGKYKLARGFASAEISYNSPAGFFLRGSFYGKYDTRNQRNVFQVGCHTSAGPYELTLACTPGHNSLELELKLATPTPSNNVDIIISYDYASTRRVFLLNVKKLAMNLNLTIENAGNTEKGETKVIYSSDLTEPLTLFAAYDLATQDKLFTFASRKGASKSEIQAKWTKINDKLTADVIITTPITQLMRLTLMADHSDALRTAKVTLQYGINKILANTKWQLEHTGYGEMSADIKSTFAGFEKLSFAVNYSLEEDKKAVKVSGQRNNDKSEIFVILNTAGEDGATEASLSLTTPFAQLENLLVSGKVSLNTPGEKLVSLLVQKNGAKYEIQANALVSSNSAEVSVKVFTPFPHLSEMSASGKYYAKNYPMYIQFESAKNNANKVKILAQADLRKNALLFQASTPIQNFEQLELAIVGDVDRSNADISLRATKNAQTIQLKMTGQATAEFVDMQIEGKTPFRNYEQFKLTGKLEKDDEKLHVTLNGDFNGKNIEVTGEYALVLRGSKPGRSLELAVKTPFRGYESLSINGNLQNRNFRLTVTGSGRNIDISGAYDLTQNGVTTRASVKLPNRSAYTVKSSLVSNRGEKEVILSIEQPAGAIDFSASARTTDDTLRFASTLSTPYDAIRSAKVDGQLEVNPQQHRAQFTAEYNGKRVAFNADLQQDDDGPQINVSFESPITGNEPVEFNGKYSSQWKNKSVRGLFKWPAKEIDCLLNVQLQNNGRSSTSRLVLNTPVNGREEFTASHLIRSDEVSVLVKRNSKALMELKAKAKFKFDINQGNLQADFNSLIRGFENIKLTGNYDLELEKRTGVVQLRYGERKAQLSVFHEFDGHTDQVGATFDDPYGQSVKLLGNISQRGSVSVQFQYGNGKEMKFSGLIADNANAPVLAELRAKWTGVMQADLVLDQLSNGYDLNLKSSFRNFEYKSLKLTFDDTQAALTFTNGKSVDSINANYQKRPRFANLNVTYTGNLRSLHGSIISGGYNLVGDQKYAFLKAKVAGKVVDMKSNLDVDGSNAEGKITVISPFQQYPIILEMQTTKNSGLRKADLSGTWSNRKQFTASGGIILDGTMKKFAYAKAYWQGDVLINTRLDVTLGQADITGKFTFNAPIVLDSLIVDFEATKNSLDASANWYNKKQIVINGKWVYTGDQKKIDLSLNYFGQLFQVNGNFNTQGKDITGDISVVTPFQQYPVTGEFALLSQRDSHYTLEASTTWRQQKQMTLKGKFAVDSGVIEGSASVNTQFRLVRNADATFKFSRDSQQLTAVSVIQYNNEKKIDLTLKGTKENNDMRLDMSLVTPFYPVRTVKLNGQLTEQSQQKYALISSLEWEENKISLSGTGQSTGFRSANFNLKLTTSFPRVPTIKASGLIALPRYDNIDIKLNLQTPFAYVRNTDMELEYDMTNLVFRNLQLKYSEGSYAGSLTAERNADKLTAIATYTTPNSSGSKTYQVDIKSNRMSLSNTNLEVVLTTPSNTHSLSSRWNIASSNSEYIANIQSPYLKANVDAKRQSSASKKQTDYRVKAGVFEHSFNGNLAVADDEITGESNIASRYFRSGNYNAKFNLKKLFVQGNFDTELTVITPNGKSHRMGMKYQNDDGNIEAKLTVNSPYLPSTEMEMTGVANLKPNSIAGALTYQTPNTLEKISASLLDNDQQIFAQIKIDVGSIGLRDISAVGQLNRKGGLNHDATVTLTTLSGANIVSWSYAQQTNSLSAQINLETPIMNIEKYAMEGKLNPNAAEIVVSTPTRKHSVAFNLKKTEDNVSVIARVSTPWFNIGTMNFEAQIPIDTNLDNPKDLKITFRTSKSVHALMATSRPEGANVLIKASLDTSVFGVGKVSMNGKLTRNRMNPSLELTFIGQKSTQSIRIQCKCENEMNRGFALELNTPLFGIGKLTVNGKVHLASDGGADGVFEFRTNRQNHIVVVTLTKVEDGKQFELKIDSPMVSREPFQVSGVFANRNMGKVRAALNMNSRHSVNVNFDTDGHNADGAFILKSPYLSEKSWVISGEIKDNGEKQTGFLNLVTPYKKYTVSGEVKRVRGHSLDASITIDTPFMFLPKTIGVSMSGDIVSKNKNAKFQMEVVSASGEVSKLAFNVKHVSSQLVRLATEIQLMDEQLVHLIFQLNYNPTWTSLKPHFEISNGPRGFIYALTADFHQPREDKFDAGLALNKNGELITFKYNKTIERDGKQVHAMLETPFANLPVLSVQLKSKKQSDHSTWFNVVIQGQENKFQSTGTFKYESPQNTQANLEYSTNLFGGYQGQLNMDRQTESGRAYRQAELILPGNRKYSYIYKRENNLQGTKSLFKLYTPQNKLRNIEINGKHDYTKNQCQLDITLNGQKMLDATIDINGKSASIDNPVQPIGFAYDYKNAGYRNMTIKGEFWTDLSNRRQSAIGFEATVEVTPQSKRLSLQTIHPSKFYVIEASQAKSNGAFEQKVRVQYEKSSAKAVSYTIRLEENRRFTVGVRTPSRCVSLEGIAGPSPRWTGGVGATLKWDACKDTSKAAGFQCNYDNADKITAKCTFQHFKLAKPVTIATDLTWKSNEIVLEGELDYSSKEEETLKGRVQVDTVDGLDVSLSVSHPVSNLAMLVRSRLSRQWASLNVQYKNKYGQTKVTELRAAIDQAKHEIKLLIKSPVNNVDLTGRVLPSDTQGIRELKITGRINDRHPVNAAVTLNRQRRSASVQWELGAGARNGQLMAMMPNGKMMQMSLMKSNRNQLDLTSELTNNRTITTKANWNPQVINEFSLELNEQGQDIAKEVERVARIFGAFVTEESKDKSRRISDNIGRAVSPAIDDIKRDLSTLRQQIGDIRREIQRAYDANEYNVKETLEPIVNIASAICNWVCKQVDDLSVRASRRMSQWAEDTYEAIFYGTTDALHALYDSALNRASRFRSTISRSASEWAVLARKAWRSAIQMSVEAAITGQRWISECARSLAVKYQPMIEEYLARLDQSSKPIKRAIQNYVESVSESIKSTRMYQQLMELVEEGKATVRELMAHRYYNATRDFVSRHYYTADRLFKNHVGMNMAEQWSQIQNHPNVRYTREVATNVAQKAVELYNDYDVDSHLRQLARVIYLKGKDLAFFTVYDLASQLPTVDVSYTMDYQPEEGRVEYVQTLPFDWNQFDQLPAITSKTPEVRRLVQLKNRYASSLAPFDPRPLYYKYKSSLDYTNWIPPFKGQALMVGNQHFRTFDGKFYEFSDKCSYLLAKDFVNGKFSVIAHFNPDDQEQATKMEVQVDGRKVTVGSDDTVMVNERLATLPMQFGQTRISKTDSGSIRVESGPEDNPLFTLEINNRYKVRSLTINGLYHGKTGGLFGNFDNEPSNDFEMPGGEKTEDPEEFARAWQLSSSCTPTGNRAVAVPKASADAHKPCQELFANQDSPLKNCFLTVNPSPFERICAIDVSIENSDLAACNSAKAYAWTCKLKGINLQLPTKCSTQQHNNEDGMGRDYDSYE